jgi:molybdate transport system regulatory protein
MGEPKLTLRIDLGDGRALGPGKIRLLEAIDRTGSIMEAGLNLRMSYRRAWLLVDDMNNCFRDRVVATRRGGPHGGRVNVTPLGKNLIERYRAIEIDALTAVGKHLEELEAAFKGSKTSYAPTSIRRPLRTATGRR